MTEVVENLQIRVKNYLLRSLTKIFGSHHTFKLNIPNSSVVISVLEERQNVFLVRGTKQGKQVYCSVQGYGVTIVAGQVAGCGLRDVATCA